MRQITKKLAVAATATALIGAIGASVAQTETDQQQDPMSTQKVEVNGSGQQIYFFRDQGNSPETDPAAHLMLIKHQQEVPVAETTTTTTVAQSTTSNDAVTTAMPAASDTSNTDTSTDQTVAAPAADTTPMPAPKADRN